jgi:hypothetical protein
LGRSSSISGRRTASPACFLRSPSIPRRCSTT